MLNYQRVCELRGSNLFDLKLQLHNLARAACPACRNLETFSVTNVRFEGFVVVKRHPEIGI